MLRHRQDDNPVRLERAMDARQHGAVLVDMLDDVERPDGVELRFIGQVAGVGLHEFNRRQASLRVPQTGEMLFQANELIAAFRRQPLQHKARSASDFEDARTGLIGDVLVKHAQNNAVPGLKPKVPRLQAAQAIV